MGSIKVPEEEEATAMENYSSPHRPLFIHTPEERGVMQRIRGEVEKVGTEVEKEGAMQMTMPVVVVEVPAIFA